VNGHIKRTYDEARTPYQRLMESRQVHRNSKQQLQAIYNSLNPAELQWRLSQLRQQLQTASAAKSEIVLKRQPHGPPLTINKQRGVAPGALRERATA
jgi:hypothetical protein